MRVVSGFSIVERRQITEDQIALTIYAKGKGDSAGMLFQHIGNEWNIARKARRREEQEKEAQ